MTAKAQAVASPNFGIGGIVRQYLWHWQGQTFTVVYEMMGEGSPVLLLSALSTVSTRSEMRQVAARLKSYQAIALDWLGFGESERPPLKYRAELYHQLLADFTRDVLNQPTAVVAAGHAAGYVMQVAQNRPQAFTKIVLAAPTWRGPLTVMGVPWWIANAVRETVRSPLLGQGLYQLNTAPAFLRYMYGSHVYANQALLTPEFIAHKRRITQQSGARYAPVAFVTGALDPVKTQADFLAYFQPLPVPVLVVVAEGAPSASKAEMEAISQCPNVETERIPGALGLYEEYADELADTILKFFKPN